LVWQAAESILENIPFEDSPEQIRYDILLALQELLTNVLRHGYRGDASRPIEMAMRGHADEFVLELVDHGPAFDPTALRDPDFDHTRVGGFGVYIARTVLDELSYERRGQCNVLTLVKRVNQMTVR
jgi:anti-sigma regulatory factor (Ser/Thr protein kinase)